MNYPPSYQYAPPQNSNMAVISLIAGITGLTVFPIIGSLVAVILGHMAKGEINRSGGQLGGGGLATAGLVLGYLGLVLSVGGLCIFGAILGFGICAPLLFLNNSNSSGLLLPLLLAV